MFMYQLLNQVGRPLPSPKDLFVLLVMGLAALGAGLKAQLPGQVTVLDTTSAPWSFLCSVEADPNSENLVFFDLPPLDYDLTMEPIFDPEGHCPDCGTAIAGRFDAKAGHFGRQRIAVAMACD